MTMTNRALEWLTARGLDVELADRLGVDSGKRGAGEALVIPTFRGERIVARKYRLFEGTRDNPAQKWLADNGGETCFWNEDVLRDQSLDGRPLIITEGHWDAIVAIQCGFPRTVSVPNGATAEREDDKAMPAGKYEFVQQIMGTLSKERFPEIILATDSDGPGRQLLHDLSVQLGRYRCKFVGYGEGAKDLNDVLMRDGQAGVAQCLGGAKFVAMPGVYQFSDMPPLPPETVYEIGSEARGMRLLGECYKMRLGDLTVLTGVPGYGKALALDTRLPTPTGWTTMGDVRAGDLLLDEGGRPCRVVRATEVMHGRTCYRMAFSGGGHVVADADHQWLTSTEKSRRSARNAAKRGPAIKPKGSDQSHKRTHPSVVTTAEIATSMTANKKTNHQIGLCGPIEPGLEYLLPIDPYVLGVWLGDGTSDAAALTSGVEDVEEMEGLLRETGIATTRRRAGASWTLGLTGGYGSESAGRTLGGLRLLGVLRNKHIPEVYLRASVADRLSLLQGLMDTDGHVTISGQCEFCTTSPALADGIFELASSMGLKVSRYEGEAKLYDRVTGPKFRISWCATLPVFRLRRKLARLPNATPRVVGRYVTACDEVESVPVRCIQVDSASRLFLCTERFIPTHNTSFVNDVCCRVADHYDLKIAWASFEQSAQRDMRRNLTKWWNSRGEDFVFDPGGVDEWLDDHHVVISAQEDEEVTLDWLLDAMEGAVVRHGCKIVVIDPWNEIEHKRQAGDNETDYTGRAIRTIKRFAKRFQVHVILVAHPAKLQKENGKYQIPSLYDISGSANFYNKCDVGIVVHRQSKDDTVIKIQKVRYHGVIGKPGEIAVQYNGATGRFIETEKLA